jgi:Ca-activated chloride channel family protein
MGFAAASRLLWLLAAAAYTVALVLRARRDRANLARFGEPPLVAGLVDPAHTRDGVRAILSAAALVLLIVAAARPQLGSKLAEVKRRGNDVFIAMDVSASMLAEDEKPSRLVKARRSLGLLVNQLKGDRVGIIAFAGEAFLVCPLTLDADAARLFLEYSGPDAAPVPGTSLGAVVRRAMKHLVRESRARKVLVVLTDGEDTAGSDPVGAAREAKDFGLEIYAIGIGTPQGDVIRTRDAGGAVTGFKKDEKGGTVLSRLDEATLSEMSRLTGGRYYRGSSSDAEIYELADLVSSGGGQLLSSRGYLVREDRYQFPLLPAILLLMAELLVARRRGFLAAAARELSASLARLRTLLPGSAAVLALVLLPSAGRADLKSHLNKGNSLLMKGDIEGARQEYFSAQAEAPDAPEPPYNTGNTYLYEGKLEDALKSFSDAQARARNPQLRSFIAYNRGWALARLGRNPEAIEAFKECLRLSPADEDAKFNIEYLKAGRKPKQQGGQGQPKPQQGQQQQKLSKEDAERVMEMVRDQERKAREARARQGGDRKAPGGKDW